MEGRAHGNYTRFYVSGGKNWGSLSINQNLAFSKTLTEIFTIEEREKHRCDFLDFDQRCSLSVILENYVSPKILAMLLPRIRFR